MLKKGKRRSVTDSSTISTLLGRDTVIEGTLAFTETIRIDGRIKGKLTSTQGTLIVGEHASIDADIAVAVAIIHGTVNGHVVAKQRAEVHAPAKVKGDITAPTVTIDSGVTFNGNCKMQPTDKPVDKSVAPRIKTDANAAQPKSSGTR